MAYIPQKPQQQNQEQGMNVMSSAPQPMQQGQPQEGQQPPQLGGGESQQIGGAAPQAGQQQQKMQQARPQQAKGSGMYSNIHKYAEANKPQAQRMATAAVDRYSQQAQRIQDSIAKQRAQFGQQAQVQQEKLGQAQQFGQGTIQKAAGQESQEMLNYQQQELQNRLGRFGEFDKDDYTQDIQSQQEKLNQEQARIQALQTAAQQAEQGFDKNAFQQGLQGIQAGVQSNYNFMTDPNWQAYGTHTPTGIAGVQDFTKSLKQSDYDTQRSAYEKSLGDIYGKYDAAQRYQQAQQQGGQINPEDKAAYDALYKEKIVSDPSMMAAGYDSYSQGFQLDPTVQKALDFRSQFDAEKAYTDSQKALQAGQADLGTAQQGLESVQEQQRMLENRNRLQGELESLQAKADAAPGSLTDEEVSRFRDLSQGIERFDRLGYDYSEDTSKTKDLTGMAKGIEQSDVRSRVLRNMLGGQAYGGGKAALDDLILQGSDEARQTLTQGIKGRSDALSGALKEAETGSRRQLGELYSGTQDLQEALNKGLITEQQAIDADLEDRMATGRGTLLQRVKESVDAGQGISQEEMDRLGLKADQKFYDLDLNQALAHDPTKFQKSDVANLTDVARVEALGRLAGGQQTQLQNMDDIRARSLGGVSQGEKAAAEAFMGQVKGAETGFNKQMSDMYKKYGDQIYGGSGHVQNVLKQLAETGRTTAGNSRRGLGSLEDLSGTGADMNFAAMDDVFNDPMYWGEGGKEFFNSGGQYRFADAYKGLASERDALLGRVDANRAGDIALESTARQEALKNLANVKNTYKSFNPYKK